MDFNQIKCRNMFRSAHPMRIRDGFVTVEEMRCQGNIDHKRVFPEALHWVVFLYSMTSIVLLCFMMALFARPSTKENALNQNSCESIYISAYKKHTFNV